MYFNIHKLKFYIQVYQVAPNILYVHFKPQSYIIFNILLQV